MVKVTSIETGTAMVMPNAAPHQPLSFWLWFGGIAIFSSMVGFWMYRRLVASKG